MKTTDFEKKMLGKWFSENANGQTIILIIDDSQVSLKIGNAPAITFDNAPHFFGNRLCFLYEGLKYYTIPNENDEILIFGEQDPITVGQTKWQYNFYKKSN